MVTVFLICWGPYAVQSLAGVLGYVSFFLLITTITVILSGGSPGSLCISSPVRQARGPRQPRHLRLDEQGGQWEAVREINH